MISENKKQKHECFKINDQNIEEVMEFGQLENKIARDTRREREIKP